MPFVGEVDLTAIIANLGDDTHGLRPAAALNTAEQDEAEIFRASLGEVEVSTSVGLARPCKPIWDVNGYYRSLGIGWPFKPSAGDLRLAYIGKEGWGSERLTYILKQLKDPVTRKAYDNTPLGRQYRDKYVLLAEMRELAIVAGEESAERGEMVTVESLLAEEEKFQHLKNDRKPLFLSGWDWGYYILKTRKYETVDIANWQTMLISAFAELDVVVVVSVGYIGNTRKGFELRELEGRTVFFLEENTEPTIELAEAAASLYMAHRKRER